MQGAHSAGEFAPETLGYYNSKSRTFTDVWATILYGLTTALVCIWGIVAFVKAGRQQNPDYYHQFINNSTTCDNVRGFDTAFLAYLSKQPASDVDNLGNGDDFSKAFTRTISYWLPITAVAGIAGSFVYVLLFRRFPASMVNISIIATIVWSIIMTIAGFAAFFGTGLLMLFCTLFTCAFFWWIRHDLKMCARLMGVAGLALTENGWIIPSTMAVMTGGIGLLLYQVAAVVSASSVVTYSSNSRAVSRVTNTDPDFNELIGVCYDRMGHHVSCCQASSPGWVVAFILIAVFSMLWLGQVMQQVKLSIVSHVIAQWYWHPAGQWSGLESRAATGTALRHTLLTNFGTVSFAALLMALIEMLRTFLESKKRDNLCWCIINCILQPILAMCEQFTRFASIAAAITGKPFVAAAREVFGVLKRTFLQTYTLWWVPGFATGVTVFLVSLAWAVLSFGVTWFSNGGLDDEDRSGAAWLVAFVCGSVMVVILSFASGLLLDCINTVYICFAMDRDQRVVTRPDIHTVYLAIPTLQGAVVEQPGGEVEYGRPDQAPAQQPAPTQPLYATPYGHSTAAPPPAATHQYSYTYTYDTDAYNSGAAATSSAAGPTYPTIAPASGPAQLGQQGYTNTKYPGF